MNDVVRDPAIIAGEINFIKRQTAAACLSSAVEIGKLLCEVKSGLKHGDFGKWLEDNVNYSVSTANNLMKLYNSYGESKQLSAFDENASDIFGALSPSQALVLAALPEEQRVEYVQTHDVENESVKKMKKQVEELTGKLKDSSENNRKLSEDVKKLQKSESDKKAEISTLKGKLEESEKEVKLQKLAVKDANSRAHNAEIKLKESVDKGSTDIDELKRQYEASLEEYKKKLELAKNSVTEKFAVHFEIFQNEFNALHMLVLGCPSDDKETSDKLRGALSKALNIFLERV